VGCDGEEDEWGGKLAENEPKTGSQKPGTEGAR